MSPRFSQTAYPSAPQRDPIPGRGEVTGLEPGRIPYRQTPPWGEPAYWDELEAGVLPASFIHPSGPPEDLDGRINLAYGHEALQLSWSADPQYGYPPPGAPNEQSFQSGHTQITVINQSAEQGWGTDPAFSWPRYPHMENHARAYSWGIARRNGQMLAEKEFRPIELGMQQRRDMLLRDIVTHHAPHGTIFRDAPSVPNTYTVTQVSPLYEPALIGEEGVLP